MDIEKVALEAIKQKIEEIFKKVTVSTVLDGRDILIRITIPNELGQTPERMVIKPSSEFSINGSSNLDAEAQSAANELLGL